MRKRPRTRPVLDLPCTSALSSLQPPAKGHELIDCSTEQFATRTHIDNALAEIDVGLGLACSSTTAIPSASNSKGSGLSIEDELDAMMTTLREERKSPPVIRAPTDDTSSCVSGSGSLAERSLTKAEDCSPALDVLHELSALETRTSTTVMSPPIVKSMYKRRRRR